jgi:hypothetical protein
MLQQRMWPRYAPHMQIQPRMHHACCACGMRLCRPRRAPGTRAWYAPTRLVRCAPLRAPGTRLVRAAAPPSRGQH